MANDNRFHGLITKEEFQASCKEIVKRNKQIKDSFDICHFEHDVSELYLRKISHCVIDAVEEHSELSLQDLELKDWEELLPLEECKRDHVTQMIKFEHHIVYSQSYCVPVCYFLVTSQDGAMLSLEDIWKLIPLHHQHLLKDKWFFITQQEHPYLQRPFYQLHPCHTANFMKDICGKCSPPNYLLTWLSAIGPIVNLHISIKFLQND